MAVEFNGTDDTLVGAQTAAINDIFFGGGTITAWIYLNSYGGAAFGRIADKTNNASSGWSLMVDNSFSPNAVRFFQYAPSAGSWGVANSISTGAWYHIALSYDANTSTTAPVVYVNAVVQTTSLDQAISGTPATDAGNDLLIGNRIDEARGFDGRIADVRLYDRVLSLQEVQNIYTARGADRILGGLQGRWRLNDLSPGSGVGSPAIDSVETFVGNATSLTVDVPPKTVDGDLMVAVICPGGGGGGTAAVVTTPAGWTLRANQETPAAPSHPSIYIFDRIAASEPASYTFSINQNCTIAGHIHTYRGVTRTNVVTNDLTGTSIVAACPSVVLTNTALVVRAIVWDANVVPTTQYTIHPANTAGRDATFVSGVGNGVSMAVADKVMASGVAGLAIFNPTAADQWAGITVAYQGGSALIGATPAYCYDTGGNNVHLVPYSSPVYIDDICSRRRRGR